MTQSRNRSVDDVVTQHYSEGFSPYGVARHEDCMPQAQSFLLTYIRDVDHVRNAANLCKYVPLFSGGKHLLKLVGHIKMVLDGILATARDDRNVANPGLNRFLDDVLNQRLIY